MFPHEVKFSGLAGRFPIPLLLLHIDLVKSEGDTLITGETVMVSSSRIGDRICITDTTREVDSRIVAFGVMLLAAPYRHLFKLMAGRDKHHPDCRHLTAYRLRPFGVTHGGEFKFSAESVYRQPGAAILIGHGPLGGVLDINGCERHGFSGYGVYHLHQQLAGSRIQRGGENNGDSYRQPQDEYA